MSWTQAIITTSTEVHVSSLRSRWLRVAFGLALAWLAAVSSGSAACLSAGKACGVNAPANDRLCCTGMVCGWGNVCRAGCRIFGTVYQPGAKNPANPCQSCQPALSTTSWSGVRAGTACGNPASTVCDRPDTCDGRGACLPNYEPATKICRAPADACDPAESCTGSSPTCPADVGGCVCGDGTCTAGYEDDSSCYVDCGSCGDGLCTTGYEDDTSCSTDCCGDGSCQGGTPDDCYVDCGYCGDGICSPGYEDDANCNSDCCGNGSCEAGTPDGCYFDCGSCGDGICTPGYEDDASCNTDCCGDGSCQGGTPDDCYVDCGYCGDATCTLGDEDDSTCYVDCGYCGDGTCTPGYEDDTNCCDDCGCVTGTCVANACVCACVTPGDCLTQTTCSSTVNCSSRGVCEP